MDITVESLQPYVGGQAEAFLAVLGWRFVGRIAEILEADAHGVRILCDWVRRELPDGWERRPDPIMALRCSDVDIFPGKNDRIQLSSAMLAETLVLRLPDDDVELLPVSQEG